MESDPVVSSTVVETDPLSTGIFSGSEIMPSDVSQLSAASSGSGQGWKKPAWQYVQYSPASDSYRVNHPLPTEWKVDDKIQDFPTPELEFDEIDMELAAIESTSFDANDLDRDRMTPDGYLEDDYEQELGISNREYTVQDVIDKDYSDISRLGILQVAGDDKSGRKVIVFSACRLPTCDAIDQQRLLSYITTTLDQYVSNDYSLVYFHYGLTNQNKPRFGWLVQAYRTVSRNFKKNLKAFYIVHPTVTVKILFSLFRPFISSKMSRKVFYIEKLGDLEEFLFVNQLPIPQRVTNHDKQIVSRLASSQRLPNRLLPSLVVPTMQTFLEAIAYLVQLRDQPSCFEILNLIITRLRIEASVNLNENLGLPSSSSLGSAYLQYHTGIHQLVVECLETGPTVPDMASVISCGGDEPSDEWTAKPEQQFNVSLEFIRMHNPDRVIPIVVEDTVDYIRKFGMETDGIFRRSVSLRKLREVQYLYNQGVSVDLRDYNDPHLAAGLLKSFFRELSAPLLTFELYDEILGISGLQAKAKVNAIQDLVLNKLPDSNYDVLQYVLQFLTEVATYASQNRMNASNLAVVFGPSLVWSRQQTSLGAITVINSFVQVLITHYESIFLR